MNSLTFKIKIFFVVLFAFATAGLYGYEYYWVRPAKECEESGRWWYGPERVCGVPVKISDMTGRHMEEPAPRPVAPAVAASGQASGPAATK